MSGVMSAARLWDVTGCTLRAPGSSAGGAGIGHSRAGSPPSCQPVTRVSYVCRCLLGRGSRSRRRSGRRELHH